MRETTHDIHVGDARDLSAIPDDSVELVVTSPPYPMIEMWDDIFADLDPAIGDAIDAGDGTRAFELMHDALDEVWAEVERVLVPGGIACINVGDATRKIGDRFELFPNHAAIIDRFRDHGLHSLPTVHWRKPTNKKTKFMGSGMIPPNAYVTLEHESILVFRNGGRRQLPSGSDDRYEAAYFWEERNRWFTDTWTDVGTEAQSLEASDRDRAGSYPVDVPYRLVNMFSIYGDTVLDPFLGTGTTTVAAMQAARNSIGVEIDSDFLPVIDDRVDAVPEAAERRVRDRLAAHREFVAEADCNYDALHYTTRVKTKQEQDIRFYVPRDIADGDDGYTVVHEPFDD